MKKQKFTAGDYHVHPAKLSKERYWTVSHLNPRRFLSIGYQWKLALETRNSSFLDIGIGSRLLEYLLQQAGVSVYSLDINGHLEPTVVADLYNIPIKKKSIECVMCYQTLEHMPFEMFKFALAEFKRVAVNNIIISLPDITPTQIFEGGLFYAQKIIRTYLKNDAGEEIHPAHQWEIGYKRIDLNAILEISEGLNLKLINHFRPTEYDWHHFFVFHL